MSSRQSYNDVHVLEFQHIGLLHIHMVITFEKNEKLNSPEDYDHVVGAKIPNGEEHKLYNAMVKHMLHDTC